MNREDYAFGLPLRKVHKSSNRYDWNSHSASYNSAMIINGLSIPGSQGLHKPVAQNVPILPVMAQLIGATCRSFVANLRLTPLLYVSLVVHTIVSAFHFILVTKPEGDDREKFPIYPSHFLQVLHKFQNEQSTPVLYS